MREDDAHVKNIVLCICDPDEAYLNRLNGFIQHQEHSPFIVRTYTGPDGICADEGIAGILLASSTFFDSFQKNREDALFEKDWGCVVFLDEGTGSLPDGTDISFGDVPVDVIDKYQSAAHIYEHLLDLCSRQGSFLIRPELLKGSPVEVYGVFSPEDKNMQKRWALWRARETARERPCLYVTFEECFVPENRGQGLSRLILLLKERMRDGDRNLEALTNLDGLTAAEGMLDLLAPADCPYDLKEMGEDEWYCWLEHMIRHGKYLAIVINFGPGVPALCLLELCSRIFVPVSQNDGQAGKDFKNLLEFMGKEALVQKMELVPEEGI